jgi:hypothetical protein
MKINEINQPQQVDEGIRDSLTGLSQSLIGDYGTAAIKGMFTGKGTKKQLEYDTFFKDFFNDAVTSLQNGIKSGIVDKNLSMSGIPAPAGDGEVDPPTVTPEPGEPGGGPTPGPTPGPTSGGGITTGGSISGRSPTTSMSITRSAAPGSPTSTTTPGAPTPKTSATAPAVAAKKAQQQTTQNINNYIKQAAQTLNTATDKNQKIALTKELVNAMADRQGSPEWNNALATVQQIIKRGGVDPGFANAAIGNLKAGKTMSEAWRIYFANKLIEAVGLTWKDLGLCVLKENKKYFVASTKFAKLNYIFESILEADTGVKSVGDYMLEWFTAWMGGTAWDSYKPKIIQLCQNIENSYRKGNWKEAIRTLAKAAYAIPGVGKAKGLANVPGAAGSEAPGATKKPTADFGAPSGGSSTLAAQLDALKKEDPEGFKRYMDSLRS